MARLDVTERTVTPRELLIELIKEVRATREELRLAIESAETRLTEQMRGLAQSVGRDVGLALSRLDSAEQRLGTLAEDQRQDRKQNGINRPARVR